MLSCTVLDLEGVHTACGCYPGVVHQGPRRNMGKGRGLQGEGRA